MSQEGAIGGQMPLTGGKCVYCGKTFKISDEANPKNHNCKDYLDAGSPPIGG